jgi:UDP-2,3-diacylglucosamine pyrophosphatase LpxH
MTSEDLADAPEKLRCHALWVSDLHLGSVHCKADAFLHLLKHVECEKLYLVGDIIDILAMRKRVFWPSSHNKILRKLLKLSRSKTQIYYLPGNHDEAFRLFNKHALGKIRIHRSLTHTTQLGLRLLVTHGDEFDYAVRYSKINRYIGDVAYDGLMTINHYINRLRGLLGLSYWSLAAWAKANVEQADKAIKAYQHAAIHYARQKGYDGIICGHLHHPALFREDDILYCNDGDWVESHSALIEHETGELQLIKAVATKRGADNYRFIALTPPINAVKPLAADVIPPPGEPEGDWVNA